MVEVYLDASVLVALLTQDALTVRAELLLRRAQLHLLVSDLACAEYSSAIARRYRMRELSAQEAQIAFQTLDLWAGGFAERVVLGPAYMGHAEALVRRLDQHLRTPDALNIAIAGRCGATLATFDDKLAAAARALGQPVLPD